MRCIELAGVRLSSRPDCGSVHLSLPVWGQNARKFVLREVFLMANRAARFCKHNGCANIVRGESNYCDAHRAEAEAEAQRRAQANQKRGDMRRGSSRERGYTTAWSKYSKAFLSKPENKFCCLRLDNGCAVVSQCVDHIDPPDNAKDKRFWDKSNHQPACIHCNSVKGHRFMIGKYVFGADVKTR